jgi:hypothetical protein
MQPPFDYTPGADHFYHVRPDELDQLVEELKAIDSSVLKVDTFKQYTGRSVYALTFTDPAADPASKRGLFVSRPHAHEPAGVAACAELAKALAGYRDYKDQNADWRKWVLENLVVTFVPDANPGGSQRAPVKFWDGLEIPNEQFFLWMFGESGGTPGERFPRVAAWDMREVTPPALLGIAYEQIDEHTYVEPNRDYRSTFFQSFFELDKTYNYHVWLDLHQTEFLNSDRNTQVNLPTCYDELPSEMQEQHLSLGEAIHARWGREGGQPRERPVVSYRSNKTQSDFLSKVWLPISKRMIHTVTEVQNNNPRTPVPLQVRLQLVAVLETMDWMVSNTQ